ncbi:MAG: tetratricopeptide repeat protein [Gemmatimonadales bacterium]
MSLLLDEALELPAHAIPAFLDRACGGDPALRRDVERLLAADSEAGDFLEHQPRTLAGEALVLEHEMLDAPPLEGTRLGSWRLVREIGRGGMGAVMLAERADGAFEQQVAVKSIRRGLDTEEALRRFERERRILARLEHPNIARAVDGGTGPDGTPWLAMEYVSGEPITTWCARREAGLAGTLALFEQVLRAVEFAHQSFVIHRDLKPGNVFVSDRGGVKLLDFGIAKLVSGEGDDPELTLDLDRRLTPYYASPEQIRGDQISTATDVYALGVVLYELLTGTRPFRSEDRSITEAVRQVLEDDPVTPSARLGERDIGERYRSWRAEVRGDLDHIVLRALRREPAERYRTAQALLDDLERWRLRLPVQATPQTRRYRLRRFVQRNRVAVLGGAAVVAALVVGMAAFAWQARVARLEAQKATRISAFVMSLLDVANPNIAKGDTLSSKALLDRGVERAEQELAGQPAIQAEIFHRLGELYFDLALHDEAQEMATRALALGRQAFGAESREVATSLVLLGAVLTNRGQYFAAESVMTAALDLSRRVYGPRTPEAAMALSWLGTINRMVARFDSAERYFRASIAIKEETLDADHPRLADDVNALSIVLERRGRHREALETVERGLAIRRKALGPEHVETALSMEGLARILPRFGRFAEAESLQLASLAIRRRLLGPNSVILAQSLSPLAFLAVGRGEYRKADSLITEAARLFRGVLGDAHPHSVVAMSDVGFIRMLRRDFAAAESLLVYAHGIARRAYGDDHVLTLRCLTTLGMVYGLRGELERAESVLRESLERKTAALGPDDPSTLASVWELSTVLRQLGRDEEAGAISMRALAELRRNPEGRELEMSRLLLELGILARGAGRLDESRRHLEEVWTLGSPQLDVGSAWAGWMRIELGHTLMLQGESRRASELLREGMRAVEAANGPGDPLVREARAILARAR